MSRPRALPVRRGPSRRHHLATIDDRSESWVSMPVIAVINCKGGSGKSTLATHLAACLAHRGLGVMLGDIDRQPSTTAWLRRRAAHALRAQAIVGRSVDPKDVLRAPQGVSHTVLDTPGGFHGFELARILMFADAVLMPVCHSAFDRESAAACFAELKRHPRVASGRCKVAAVGMRIDSRTHGEEVLREWAAALELPFVGVLRETQTYVRCVERGLSIFDLPLARVQADLDQWQPIMAWLDERLQAPERQEAPALQQRRAPLVAQTQPSRLMKPVKPAAPAALVQPGRGGLRRLWSWLMPVRQALPTTRS